MKQIYAYIATKRLKYRGRVITPGNVIYIGCSSDLLRRHDQHLITSGRYQQRINDFLIKWSGSWEVYHLDIILNNLYGEKVRSFDFDKKSGHRWERILIKFFNPPLNIG